MTDRRRLPAAIACLLVGQLSFAATSPADPPVPGPIRRTILALYDSADVATPRYTKIHTLAEMPLNHLGLIVRYHDIRRGIPPAESLADVRGVLTWFQRDEMADPRAYLRWVEGLIDSGRPLVVMGLMGVARDGRARPTPFGEINRVLGRLGWQYDGGWLTSTYGARYRIQDKRLLAFERPLPIVAPPYARVRATSSDARIALQVGIDGRQSTESDLIVISPRGAYVAPDYAYFFDRVEGEEFRQWYLDPFEFFREVFRTDDVPKPDTATLAGRRIYYSHLDGDGWRNLTQVEPHKSRYAMSARVVLDDLVRAYPDLPVTIAAIVGDLDRDWFGSNESVAIAREIYREPNVEAAIHTYSHPFEWGAFDPARAQGGRGQAGGPGSYSDLTHKDGLSKERRSYVVRPFSLATEVDEAAAFVDALLPAGKRVRLLQWTGDTLPFESAIAQARKSGLANINGGDTRFDREYPSASWVAPLASRVGQELQVYASNSNENTYTDLWRDRFFGFSFLAATVRNTGVPRRLKPFNIYYHMYSGERLSSLNAVRANLDYARSLPLIPIDTSRFSRIVEGFFSLAIEPVGPRVWRVRDRGALQTIRFDRATFDGVDFTKSRGVIGQRHELGSLFVALDETEPSPIVALKRIGSASREPAEGLPYLVESRWRVFDVRRDSRHLRYATEGFGPGEATWQWPSAGAAIVTWRSSTGRSGQVDLKPTASGLIHVRLPQLTAERVEVTIVAKGGTRDAR